MSITLSRKVKDYRIKGKTIREIIESMESSGGFIAKDFSLGVKILKEMINDKKCLKFLSFPACIVATGLRGVIAEMIERGIADVVITTCGTLDHDLARAWGGEYYHGSFELDDNKLHEEGINRLGNILIPNNSYGKMLEERMMPILEELVKKKEEWSSAELCKEFGLRLSDKNSILYQAAKKSVPVFVPGITDGAFGTNLLWFSQDHNFKLNLLKDEKSLSDIAFTNKRTGALIIGGGISKHHTIWWNQFKGGLNYVVAITTAVERDGSLSGARVREAVSWGKVNRNARKVTVQGDATILLPLMLAGAYE